MAASESTSSLPAFSNLPEHPILAGSHAVDTIVGLLASDDPLDPTLAVEDISGLDQDACLDRAGRAFSGLLSLGRLSSLQVWIAGQALSRAKDLAKHGTWLKSLKERNLAESTARQAIRVFRAFPDPTLLPSQITETKEIGGIVQPRPPKEGVRGGDPNEMGSKSVEPDRSTRSMPGGRHPLDPSNNDGDVEVHNDVDVEDVVNEVGGEPGGWADGRAEVAQGPTGPKWFDGEATGGLGKGYAWQVLMAGEDVRVVWVPIAAETDHHVVTTTGVRLAREEGIYRTRRDALLGASALLTEEVERLKADLDDATRSLTKVLDLIRED